MTAYCQWCGQPATTDVLIEPAQFRSIKRVKSMVRRENRAYVCERCTRAERELVPDKNVVHPRRAAESRKWKRRQEILL